MKKNKTYLYDYYDVIKKDTYYKIYCNKRKLKKIIKKYYTGRKKGNIFICAVVGYDYDNSITKNTFNEKNMDIWIYFMFRGVERGLKGPGKHINLFCNSHAGNLHSWYMITNSKNYKIYNSLFYLEKQL